MRSAVKSTFPGIGYMSLRGAIRGRYEQHIDKSAFTCNFIM
jgi:hypothetical protein